MGGGGEKWRGSPADGFSGLYEFYGNNRNKFADLVGTNKQGEKGGGGVLIPKWGFTETPPEKMISGIL